MSARLAFTLIEMLVVVLILMLLFAIGGITLAGEQRDSRVRAEAERLAAFLREARSRAMREEIPYGVAFHIENPPGSDGSVLSNASGGHWYRLIGPERAQANAGFDQETRAAATHTLPLAGAYGGSGAIYRNFPDFCEAVERSWRGDPQVLEAKRVRFLALSDSDEGPRRAKHNNPFNSSAPRRFYGHGGETTYPRPWFGYYDPAARRWYAWGGYDPSRDHSGFFYEGADGDIVGCVQPNTRRFDNNFDAVDTLGGGTDWLEFRNKDHNGDGDTDDHGERELGWEIWAEGEPRPLVNAHWLDAVIVFRADGTAEYQEWFRGRRAYANQQSDPDPRSSTGYSRNGVADMAMVTANQDFKDRLDWLQTGPEMYNDATRIRSTGTEVQHYRRHTGGWYITLAPDARRERADFHDARAVLDSITPAWRVYIGAHGAIDVIRVQRRRGYPDDSLNPFPGNPSFWTTDGGGDANPIWREYRDGWLHEPSVDPDFVPAPVPRGQPITDKVSERMLTDRIWWIEP